MVAKKVAPEVGIAVHSSLNPDDITFGRLPAMSKIERIPVARDFAAPVLVVPLARIGPMAPITVEILVRRIVALDVALSKITQVPPERLSERNAVLGSEVEPRGGAKAIRALLSATIARHLVDVLCQQVSAPPAGIARHEAKTVVGIERIVPIWQPHDWHTPETHPHVAEHDVSSSLILGVTADAPVQMVDVVGACRECRGRRERHTVLCIARQLLGEKMERTYHRIDTP